MLTSQITEICSLLYSLDSPTASEDFFNTCIFTLKDLFARSMQNTLEWATSMSWTYSKAQNGQHWCQNFLCIYSEAPSYSNHLNMANIPYICYVPHAHVFLSGANDLLLWIQVVSAAWSFEAPELWSLNDKKHPTSVLVGWVKIRAAELQCELQPLV